jgi:hypothetical protein
MSTLNRRLKFDKRRQLFIRTHNETLTVATMRVRNPDCSPVEVHGCNAAPTPTGFAEMVSDDFPVFHALILPLVPFHRKTALCQKYLFTALPQPRV